MPWTPAVTPYIHTASGGGSITHLQSLLGGNPTAVQQYAEAVIAQSATRILALVEELEQARNSLQKVWPQGAASDQAFRTAGIGVNNFTDATRPVLSAAQTISKVAQVIQHAQTGYNTVMGVAEPGVASLMSNPWTYGAGVAAGQATSFSTGGLLQGLGQILSSLGATEIGSYVTALGQIGSGVSTLVDALGGDGSSPSGGLLGSGGGVFGPGNYGYQPWSQGGYGQSPYTSGSYPTGAYPTGAYPTGPYTQPAGLTSYADPGSSSPTPGSVYNPVGYQPNPYAPQAWNQQPATYQPANYQPANYQPANYQPGTYPPAWKVPTDDALGTWIPRDSGDQGGGHGGGNGGGDRGGDRGSGTHDHHPGPRADRSDHGGHHHDKGADDGTKITVSSGSDSVVFHVDGDQPTKFTTQVGDHGGNAVQITVNPDKSGPNPHKHGH